MDGAGWLTCPPPISAFTGGSGVRVGIGATAELLLPLLVEAGFGAWASRTQPPKNPPRLTLAIHNRRTLFILFISLPPRDQDRTVALNSNHAAGLELSQDLLEDLDLLLFLTHLLLQVLKLRLVLLFARLVLRDPRLKLLDLS